MDINDKKIRDLLIRFLDGETRMSFDEAVKDFPMDYINEFPPNGLYSPWQLLEHLRFSQKDVLDFIVSPNYKEPEWPKDYWPEKEIEATPKMWQETIDLFKKDLESLKKLALDQNLDLSQTISWGSGQTIFEEILKVSDHNSAEIGEFAGLHQVMNTWPKDRKP